LRIERQRLVEGFGRARRHVCAIGILELDARLTQRRPSFRAPGIDGQRLVIGSLGFPEFQGLKLGIAQLAPSGGIFRFGAHEGETLLDTHCCGTGRCYELDLRQSLRLGLRIVACAFGLLYPPQ
jgi:hypothetical protein